VVFGWGNTIFSNQGASASKQGETASFAPKPSVNKEQKQIQFVYTGDQMGVTDWAGAKFYITTWDITGEGEYRHIYPEATDWAFGGGDPDSAKILDSLEIDLSNPSTN
jgi:hypothetical protein